MQIKYKTINTNLCTTCAGWSCYHTVCWLLD